MRFSYSTIAALTVGIISIIMLVYYYSVEKDFRQNFKTISAQFNSLQKQQEHISYGVLQGALFAYYNQDSIARDRNSIKTVVFSLYQHPLIQTEKHYEPLKETISHLKIEIETYIELVEHYLMINAGIKNSMVFLSSHEVKSLEYFQPGSKSVRAIHDIIDSVVQAKRLLDDSYLETLSLRIQQFESESYTKEQAEYVAQLLIHFKYLQKNYSLYINIFSKIMNSSLRNNLEKAQQQFEQLSEDDITYLNTLAISLFVLIFMAILTITILLYRLQKENIKLVNLHEQLNYTLQHDVLTGLLNRHSYEISVSQLDKPVILLLNISRFKLINDFYGVDSGDKLLIEISNILINKFNQEAGTCYRISGDEFAIVFEGLKTQEVGKIANGVSELLTNRNYIIADVEQIISINMAISDTKPLLETADMALKQLKLRPIGNLIHYSKELDVKEKIRSNIEITQILHDALNENRIIPYYQPIVDLKTREIVKYEALVRLKLKDGTILSPIQFLPVAQQTPLYHEITRVMISKTIAYFSDKTYRFSINFSMSDLEDEGIINTLIDHFTTYPDIVSRMDIELLESEMLTDMDKVKNFIFELKKLGCGISIDDFGSGYSNFSNLTELNLDAVKIDGSLIKEINHSPEHFKTVKAIMSLVNEMDVESIAEFVQDEASAQILSELGVTHVQGYFFGKPDEFIVEL
ncbi:MAG: bifunctional diguanylate cyclase/phosphodiesterase [Gammaproteobacteria bacterium]|nr:bifunctional diguanylate cyclase/phosphodiesterase [Gammaproteobacteria bacterium]